MTGDVLVGFVLIGVALVVFVGWTWAQVRRVDRVIEEVGDRSEDGS